MIQAPITLPGSNIILACGQTNYPPEFSGHSNIDLTRKCVDCRSNITDLEYWKSRCLDCHKNYKGWADDPDFYK